MAVVGADGLEIRFAAPGRPRLGSVMAPRNVAGLVAGGDLAALGKSFRRTKRQVIEITPNDRPG